MKFGYARVSTVEQNLGLQIDALLNADCDRIFEETISSRKVERPVWEQLQSLLRAGDTVMVYKLDRIARSTSELLAVMDRFNEMGVAVGSLHEPWVNTSSPSGKMIMTIMAGIAEFERELIRQRAADGREAAKRRGVHMGRPAKLNRGQIELIVSAKNNGHSVSELAASFRVSPDTIYRALKRVSEKTEENK
jgi:DNA invertase Pin-like site-specific DNA recombinase